MRAMIAANDDRPSWLDQLAVGRTPVSAPGTASIDASDLTGGPSLFLLHGAVGERAEHDRNRYCPSNLSHRLQPRFPSAIQPVRLSRGEVARIPELMRILDRRTAKK